MKPPVCEKVVWQKLTLVPGNNDSMYNAVPWSNNRSVDKILSKKFKPPSPHILDEYIYILIHNIASTFGQACKSCKSNTFFTLSTNTITLLSSECVAYLFCDIPVESESRFS